MTDKSSSSGSNAGLRARYDKEAEQYDAVRYDSAEGRFFQGLEVGLLRAWLGLSPGTRVLDIPAGTGRLSVALASTGATVIGADISANMLVLAAAKRDLENGRHAHFTQSSGSALPFPDDTFDAVISFKFFHLIPNELKPQFVREMSRVLKPGKILVAEFNSPFYGGLLAALRYYFRKTHPGGMRTKCLFPDQVAPLFDGLEVIRTCGVKLPFSGAFAAVVGRSVAESFNLWFGRLPGLKYLTYAIIVVARKPSVP
jgi:ubiquinone/menaquinone biosynthesis C-methylase UbiE